LDASVQFSQACDDPFFCVTIGEVHLMRLIELLETSASAALAVQREDGSLPSGNNGPHGHPETPVRNTAHWLVTFAALYRRTGHRDWLDGVRRAAGFLALDSNRPHGFSFHNRHAGKDRCNGLIGAAWVMEALDSAAHALGDDAFLHLAEEVFFLYPFDGERGLWEVVEIDGRVTGFDRTFNHQLWFAATASLLQGPRRSAILQRVERFLTCCDGNLRFLPGGLIYHSIPPLRVARSVGERLRAYRNEIVRIGHLPVLRASRREQQAEVLRKSIGYHTFNLYAFAMLHQQLPQQSLWTSEGFRQAVSYLGDEEFVSALEENRYAYPYNPPGFEVAYALSEFGELADADLLRVSGRWLERQLELTHGPNLGVLGRNNPDPITLTARFYEAVRLPDLLLEQLEVPRLPAAVVSSGAR
jgi:hypothetical protein